MGLGAKLTDQYVNRSFTIRKIKGNPQASNDLVQRWKILKQRFRAAKGKPNVLVEKSKFAISSREEKLGIPYEALRQRKKSKKKFSFKKSKGFL